MMNKPSSTPSPVILQDPNILLTRRKESRAYAHAPKYVWKPVEGSTSRREFSRLQEQCKRLESRILALEKRMFANLGAMRVIMDTEVLKQAETRL
jgi:hypothetical protein